MSQTTHQIESDIQSKHADLRSNLEELENRVQSITDWRRQFQNHPAAMVAAAFGGGLLLANMLGHGKGRRRPRVQSSSASQTLAHTPPSGTKRKKHEVLKTWDMIESALIGFAANKFKGMLAEIVPGFKEQLDKTEEKAGDSLNLKPPQV